MKKEKEEEQTYPCMDISDGAVLMCDGRIDDPSCPNYQDKDFPLLDKCPEP
ncbi:MAG: hypothetical protein GF364_00360 [Candidatus Lokiarchaeota archaeon]|nr:hypothetical protein [Candidatus Lokiarchaeota archaeon]